MAKLEYKEHCLLHQAWSRLKNTGRDSVRDPSDTMPGIYITGSGIDQWTCVKLQPSDSTNYKLYDSPRYENAHYSPRVSTHRIEIQIYYISRLKRRYTGTFRDLRMLRCARDMNQSCFPQKFTQMTKSKRPLELEKVLIGHEGFSPGTQNVVHVFLSIPLSLFRHISDIRMITLEV